MEEGYDAIIQAGRETSLPRQVGADDSYAVVPDGCEVEDLERFQNAPRRIRGKIKVEDAQSCIDYLNRFKTDASVIFASGRNTSIVGVLDYHKTQDDPAFGEHRVTYNPPYSEEWERWTSGDGRKFKQAEFAFFLEENAQDIVEPEAARIIEVARTLKAKKAVDFVSEQSLADGSVQFTYNEDVQGTAGRGNLDVPTHFAITIPVFFRDERWKIDAFFRYRIVENGKLVIWYDLHRLEYVRQGAFDEIVAKIKADAGVPVFGGVTN